MVCDVGVGTETGVHVLNPYTKKFGGGRTQSNVSHAKVLSYLAAPPLTLLVWYALHGSGTPGTIQARKEADSNTRPFQTSTMVKVAFVSLSLVCVAQAYLPPLHGTNTRKSDLDDPSGLRGQTGQAADGRTCVFTI